MNHRRISGLAGEPAHYLNSSGFKAAYLHMGSVLKQTRTTAQLCAGGQDSPTYLACEVIPNGDELCLYNQRVFLSI